MLINPSQWAWMRPRNTGRDVHESQKITSMGCAAPLYSDIFILQHGVPAAWRPRICQLHNTTPVNYFRSALVETLGKHPSFNGALNRCCHLTVSDNRFAPITSNFG